MTRSNQRPSPVPDPPDSATIHRVAEETTQEMLFALRRGLRTAGYHIKELDQRLGLSIGYTSQLLQGRIHLQISHVVSIAEILGVSQRSFYEEALPELSQLAATATDPGLNEDGSAHWWPGEAVLKEIAREILDDLLADSPNTPQPISPTKSTGRSREAREANRRVRQWLRYAIRKRGLSESEVARRLGKKPEWMYTRFTTKSAALRFSFCIQVLLACKVSPADFFHRALLELEGPPPQLPRSTPSCSPTRREIRAWLEPVMEELLAERRGSDVS